MYQNKNDIHKHIVNQNPYFSGTTLCIIQLLTDVKYKGMLIPNQWKSGY